MSVEQLTYHNIDPKVRRAIMFGLCIAMLGACFDGTIVGTCGSKIAEELGGSGLYTWMITAYLLCECVMIPLAGKLSDLFGRKPLFLIGLFIFCGGSVVGGMSTNMEMLCICRGVQGIGGGILIPVATAAIADLYSPEVRAKMQGMLGAIFGIGSGIGPIIGGFLTENVDWRWCFYINVPLAIVAFILTIKKFPTPEIRNKPVLDLRGMCALTVFLALLIILFECGGNEFEWASLTTAGIVAGLVVFGVLFVMFEKRAVEPVLSPKLLKNKTIMCGGLYMMIFGIGMMGAMTFSGYFGTFVLFEVDTLTASYYTLFLVVGMMITAMISGAKCEKTGYRFWLMIGPVITFVALVLMAQMSVDGVVFDPVSEYHYHVLGKPMELYCASMFLLGIGLGCMMTPVMAAVQNSSSEKDMGMNTSAVNLLRSIGTALGTAVFTMLINAQYASKLDGIPGVSDKATEFLGPMIGYLAAGMQDVANQILNGFIDSVEFGFIAGGVIILCSAVIGYFIKARSAAEAQAEAEAAHAARLNTEEKE